MKSIIVSVAGVQRDASGQEDTLELVSVGRYYRKNNIDYFTYKESELTGMDGTTTLLKRYPDSLVLIRMGAVEQRLVFYPGSKTQSLYITPYGAFELGIETKVCDIFLKEGEGRIYLQYELELEGQWQSSHSLTIDIREE